MSLEQKTHIRRYQRGNQNPYIEEVSLTSFVIFLYVQFHNILIIEFVKTQLERVANINIINDYTSLKSLGVLILYEIVLGIREILISMEILE